jgi:hypothetical protein
MAVQTWIVKPTPRTSIYLQGIESAEIIDTVHGRPSPMISASAGLQIAT